jgi:hypothetical protein
MDTKSLSLRLALASFAGSENIFSYNHERCLVTYTEGIKYLQDETNCLWLMDEIASCQTIEFRQQNILQVWQLTVFDFGLGHSSALLIFQTDGNSIPLVRSMRKCDFPLANLTIWVEVFAERIFMYLPSEY